MANNNFDFGGESYSPLPPYVFNFGIDEQPVDNNRYVLFGSINNFVAIWADATASLTNGKMYASSSGPGASFNVVNLDTEALVDYYTTTHNGAFNEPLDQEDVVDINVTM
jgi:hypothetical protein